MNRGFQLFFQHLPINKQIRVVFLPANTAALIPTMDQDVLESVKKRYIQKISIKITNGKGQSMMEFLRNINIKDVIYVVANKVLYL